MLDTLIKIKIRHELYNLDPYKEIRLKRKWRKKSNKDFISYKNGVIEKKNLWISLIIIIMWYSYLTIRFKIEYHNLKYKAIYIISSKKLK